MQIHTPSSLPSNDDFRVHLNEAARVPFAIIDLDDIGTRIFVENLADADRLIKAAVEAKRLLSPPEPPDPDTCKCGHPGYQHVYAEPERCTQCECKAFTAAPSGGVMFGPFSPEGAEAVTPAVEDSMAPPPHPVVHADGSYSFPGELSAATLYESGSDDAETAASQA